MAAASTTIIPDTDDLELLASSIIQVAEGARRLKNSRLKDRAVLLLIRDSITGNKLGLGDIADVLNAAATLDIKYLKKA